MKLPAEIFTLCCVAIFALACGQNNENKNNTEKEEAASMTQTEGKKASNDSDERPLVRIPAADRADYYSSEPAEVIDKSKTYIATVHTEKGDIVLQLDSFYAPLHTNNFVFLSRQGFYDGLTFHRVEPGFVIQGGDPLGRGNGGPGYTIPAEIGLPHEQGVIAMARQGDQVNPERRSSGSQFYITLAATPFLDNAYSVFGKVITGFDVVQKIAIGDRITKVDIEEK